MEPPQYSNNSTGTGMGALYPILHHYIMKATHGTTQSTSCLAEVSTMVFSDHTSEKLPEDGFDEYTTAFFCVKA